MSYSFKQNTFRDCFMWMLCHQKRMLNTSLKSLNHDYLSMIVAKFPHVILF